MHTFLDYLEFDFSSPSAIVQCVIGGIIALLLLVSGWCPSGACWKRQAKRAGKP